jgi:uncharacterized protein YegP (UPF0339 family)
MIRIERFEAIEISVPSGSTLTRFQFPDVPQLRNAKISSIQVYTAGSITATPLTGSTPVTTADMKKSFLTLYQGDQQLIYSLPMISLNSIVNSAADPYTFELPAINGLTISWTKSYVSLPSALATTNVAYSFGVYYNF